MGLLLLLQDLLGKEIDLVKKHLIRKELTDEIFQGEQYAAQL